MEIYKYKPKKTIKNAAILTGIFLFASSALLLISVFIQSYRGLYHASCILLASIAINLTSRFILSSYSFILDGLNFIVIKTQGKTAAQLCNISLRTAIGISDKKTFSEIEKEFGKIAVRRNFCQNMWANDEYTCIFDFDEKKSAVKFDADIYFVNEMKLRIKEAELRYGK